MKKQLKSFAGLLLLILLSSCAADQLEINETSTENSQTVWNYDGDSTTLQKVIAELKNSENRKPLERRLAKNEVLWKEAKFLLIDNKKRIMVPFLSTDKENVIGVLALVKDAQGKTTFDMAVRTRLIEKNNQLPFWNPDIWMGYFMALDKDILGIKNGNPGFRQTIANKKKSKTNARIQCDLYEIVTSHCSLSYLYDSATGEKYNYVDRGCTDTYSYTQECYWVPDPIIPIIEPTTDLDGGSGGGGSITPSLVLLGPSNKISDINDYLKCINLGQNAVLVIYVDQPTPNSSDTWSGSVYNPNVGHTFIAIQQGDGIRRVLGYYPDTTVDPSAPNDPRAFGNDQGHSFDVAISIPINPNQLLDVISYISNSPTSYNLNTYNCTDFAIAVGNLVGLNLPDSYGTWPGGGGSNPGNLGQEIRNMTFPPNVYRQTTTANAASNKGTCN